MKILQVVAYKNSGKTTLIRAFIKHSKMKSKKVAVIKHHHLDDILDDDSNDTGKFNMDGADFTRLNTPSKSLELTNTHNDLYTQIKEYEMRGVDIVILEGYKNENYPKILLTYSFTSGETEIKNIGLTNVLTSFDMRTDMNTAIQWFEEWSQI